MQDIIDNHKKIVELNKIIKDDLQAKLDICQKALVKIIDGPDNADCNTGNENYEAVQEMACRALADVEAL